VLVVLRKELVDNLRDRRSVMMALLFPLLGPLSVGLTTSFLKRQLEDRSEKPLKLGVVGQERAPELMAYLVQNNVVLTAVTGRPEELVRGGDFDVVLVVPEDYAAALRAGRPAPVQLVMDESSSLARPSIGRAQELLNTYSTQIGVLRLAARGVDYRLARAVAVERVDLSTPQSRAMLVLAMVPYFLVFSVFVGGLTIAIDTTAGERERGSLEPLLINPVPRAGFVLGKLGATLTFSAAALALGLLGFTLMPRLVDMQSLGFSFTMRPLPVFLLLLPLLVSSGAFQMMVASFSKGFKEAQTTLQLFMILPVLPGVMIMLSPVQPKTWMYAIPTFSEQLLLQRLLRGDVVPFEHLLTAVGSGTLYALALAYGAIRLYQGERVVFGKS
jgi:sodium transport system permease protein